MTDAHLEPQDTRSTLELLAEVREFFVMSRPLAYSRALPEAQRAAAKPLEHAAREQLRAADVLWAKGQAVPALGLYRTATLLFFDALASSAALDTSHTGGARFAELAQRLEPSTVRNAYAAQSLAKLRILTDAADETALTALSGAEGSSAVSEFARAAHWLAERLDLRTPLSVKLHRASRVGIALAILAGLLCAALAWAFPPVNFALNKPVRASSHAYSTVPEGAVDGIRYGQLGFHSGNDATPWLIVDLERTVTVHEVKVLGRPECCYDQAIPLAVEVSLDGETFTEVARRTEPFTQYEPWAVRLAPTQARYIRLRTMRHSYLVLSELEVY